MGGGSKSLGKGGGRPCAHRSSWVLGRIKDPSVMATKECLCIQRPLGWWTALALSTGWVALGSRCCSPGECKVFMPTIWMGAGAAEDSLYPRETQRPQLWMTEGCRRAVCVFLPIHSICQWFLPVSCLWISLGILVCPSLGHLYQGLVLPSGLQQIWQIAQNTQTN